MARARLEPRSDGIVHTTAPKRASRARRWTLTLAPLVMIGLWLAAHHRPSWYRPLVPDDEGLGRARRESANLFDEISDRMAAEEPFEITLADTSINEWIAALPRLLPELGADWPREVHEPMVRFSSGGIVLAFRVESRVAQAVLSLHVAVKVAPDGGAIRLAPLGVRLGAVPIPWSLVRDAMQAALHTTTGMSDLGDLDAPVPNRFVWPNGDRLFRIDSIEPGEGRCRVRLAPL